MSEDLKRKAMEAYIKSLKKSEEEESEASVSDPNIAMQDFDSELETLDKHSTLGGTIKATGIGLASGASLGLFNQALVKSGVMTKEELRDIKKANPAASMGSEVIGTVAPALFTGGGSLAAKAGAKGLQAGAKQAAKQAIKKSPAALATEAGNITAKNLNKILKATGNESFAKKVLAKTVPVTAGSAVEGAFYGVGELIREDAIGDAEFNAENALAYGGLGAAFGGAAGGLFGGIAAIAPVAGKVGAKLKGKSKEFMDPKQAALELVGASPSKIAKIKETRPQLIDDLQDVLVNKIGIDAFEDSSALVGKFKKLESTAGKEIDDVVKNLDDIAVSHPELMPSYQEYFTPLVNKMDDMLQKYKGVPGPDATTVRNKITDFREEFLSYSKVSGRMTPGNMRRFKKITDESINYNASDLFAKVDNRINFASRTHHRDALENVAKKVSDAFPEQASLSQRLAMANKEFSVAKEFGKSLANKTEREFQSNFLNFRDVTMAAGGGVVGGPLGAAGAMLSRKILDADVIRKMKILANVEKANQKVSTTVTNKVKGFFTGAATAGKISSTNVLLKFDFLGKESEVKSKPKTRKEAYVKIKKDLAKVAQDPTMLMDTVNSRTLNMQLAAPNTAASTQTVAISAVNFLQSKIPKDPAPSLFGKEEYEPSDMDLSKFERYVQAVSDPMSVLDDLQSGSITREQVEALKAVYPSLHRRIQETVMNEIMEKKGDVPYEKRLSLGILLNIPTDRSLTPQYMLNLQANFGANPIQEPKTDAMQARKISATGASKLEFSDRASSAIQRVQSGNPGE